MIKSSWENRLFTNFPPRTHRSNHIMASGDVRCSHSASFFEVTRRTEEDINQRPKRLREEDNTTPAILVDAPSTVTLTEEILEVNNDLLLTESKRKKHHISCNKTQSFE